MADRSSRPPPSQSPPRSAETALIQGTGQTRLRPAQTSAFPSYWNAHDQFTPLGHRPAVHAPRIRRADRVGLGSTFGGWALLVTYRCRFSIGCSEILDA